MIFLFFFTPFHYFLKHSQQAVLLRSQRGEAAVALNYRQRVVGGYSPPDLLRLGLEERPCEVGAGTVQSAYGGVSAKHSVTVTLASLLQVVNLPRKGCLRTL